MKIKFINDYTRNIVDYVNNFESENANKGYKLLDVQFIESNGATGWAEAIIKYEIDEKLIKKYEIAKMELDELMASLNAYYRKFNKHAVGKLYRYLYFNQNPSIKTFQDLVNQIENNTFCVRQIGQKGIEEIKEFIKHEKEQLKNYCMEKGIPYETEAING